jgi:HB1, ASXL, restriction endonuclease HTH domain
MSTLAVVEEILRETQVPMSVRQIVEHAGSRLPTRSKTPDTVVARDLSMDIKRQGEASVFIRTSPGRYALREVHLRQLAEQHPERQMDEQRHEVAAPVSLSASAPTPLPVTDAPPTSVLASAMKAERAAALPAKKPPAADEQTGTLH